MRLGEFWCVCESFAACGRVLQRSGEFGSVWWGFEAFDRVLMRLGGFCCIWESFGASGRGLERLGESWSNILGLMSHTRGDIKKHRNLTQCN